MKKNNSLACLIGLSISVPLAAFAQDKMEICHITGSGKTIVLNLPTKAVNKHLVNHGDLLPNTLYEDFDGDGSGNPLVSVTTCDDSIVGFVDTFGDPDDMNDLVSEYQEYQDATPEDEEFEDEDFEETDEL